MVADELVAMTKESLGLKDIVCEMVSLLDMTKEAPFITDIIGGVAAQADISMVLDGTAFLLTRLI